MRQRVEWHRRRALIDTSAYFALAYSRESRNGDARAIAGQLATERWRLFTTNFILAETHALLLTRLNRVVAGRVLAEIDHSPTTVVRVTSEDERRARAILAQYQDKDFCKRSASPV